MCIIAITNATGATMLDSQSLGHVLKMVSIHYNTSYSASSYLFIFHQSL